MPSNQDPAVQRRRLRVTLRDARQQLGYSQKEVAKALDWSPSKLLRIENGTVAISRSDLIAILAHYRIDDRARVEELLAMAQAAKQQSWSQYRDVLSPDTIIYVEFEAAASLIRSFTPFAIPGLLQTEEYADALIRALSPQLSDRLIERAVQARIERQELLTRSDPPEMFFILDEAVVRRRVGPGKVMIRQLERLKELSQQPTIHIQILPFSAGVHEGVLEPFTVLDFPDPADDELLYIEREQLVSRDAPEEVQRYNAIFLALEDLATPKGRVVEAIDQIIEHMDSRGGPLTLTEEA